MKRIKCIITIVYVAVAVQILGAWDQAPNAQEAAAISDTANPQLAVDENLKEKQKLEEMKRVSDIRLAEQVESNVFHSISNAIEEEQNEEAREREIDRKNKIRERRRKERQILERIVEAESGDQDLKGRILVANVILNRVKSRHFPDSIQGVVFAHRGSRYQFSPVQNGRYYQVTVTSKTREAVRKALDGVDYSKGALYFMCRSASDPSNVTWFDRSLTKVKEYGCHEFFR